MNRDERNLSVMEREMLVISHEQLLCEYYQRTQIHFHPDPAHEIELKPVECLVRCIICNQIPLDIR